MNQEQKKRLRIILIIGGILLVLVGLAAALFIRSIPEYGDSIFEGETYLPSS